jgi:hypothetical protein
MAICKEPMMRDVTSPKDVMKFINNPRIFQQGTTFFEDEELELLKTQDQVVLEVYEDDENQNLNWFKIKAVM